MKKLCNILTIGLTCILASNIIGCTAPSPSETITRAPIASPSYTLEVTASQTQKLTFTATPSPIHTYTPSNTKTQRPTQTQTYTPYPTLPPEEAMETVVELLETNGGCRLPCWWGITPGETEGKAAMAFLSSFAIDTYITKKRSDMDVIFTFTVPEDYQSDGKLGVELQIRDGLVRVVSAGGVYDLQTLLSEYGKPDQVLIWAISMVSMAEQAHYTLVLIYEDQGILAAYDGSAERRDPISICPISIGSDGPVVLFLWSPQSGDKIEKIGPEWFFEGPPQHLEFFYLEEATELTIDDFYEIFKDPQNASECFEMPDPDLNPGN